MKKPPISEWKLEQLVLGILPTKEEEELRALLAQDPALRQRYEDIQASDEEVLQHFPAEGVFTEVSRRVRAHDLASADPGRSRGVTFFAMPQVWISTAVAVCLAVLVWGVWGQGETNIEHAPSGGLRIKGEPSLLIHRVHDESVARLSQKDTVRRDDTLQLSITSAAEHYAVVFSIDGNRHVTLHFPGDGVRQLPSGTEPFSLPRAYRLDDAPVFERFFLVTSTSALDVDEVLSQVKQFAATSPSLEDAPVNGLPSDTRQSSILLKKVSK